VVDVVKRVRDTISRYGMISIRDGVLAAVSGGADSVCMAHILAGLQDELGFELRIAHLDHCFRGEESRRDAEFVQSFASQLGVPCFCDEEDVPRYLLSHRMSKQDAARMLRYRYLYKTMKLEYCQKIAFGHNADDQAETVLMRFIRGAGPDGLKGIPPKRDGFIIRPLLGIWREEIEDYTDAHRLEFRTDRSNEETDYTRNRVRHELIPALESYNPGMTRTLVNLGSIMTGVSGHLDRLVDEALPSVVMRMNIGQMALDSGILRGYDEALRGSILRRVVGDLRPDLGPLPFQHVENLLGLVERDEVGSAVDLPGGAQARLDHGCLVITQGDGPPVITPREVPVPGSVRFSAAGLTLTCEVASADELPGSPGAAPPGVAYFDLDALHQPLVVRPKKQGDRFKPFGMEGTKTLKELFIDEKISYSFRDEVPVLCDAEVILWVVGLRRAAVAPVTPETRRVLIVRAQTTEADSADR